MSAIKLQELTRTFGDFTAVSELSLEIEGNTVFGFLGPNGAGKTTTIRMMAGLIKPDSGSIEIGGEQIKFGEHKSHAMFGYLAEQPSFYNWMTGREYLGFTADLFGISGTEKNKKIINLLEKVGLTSAQDKKVGNYSNGMKQRLGIAQALLNDPEVLILDEPVSALDPIGRKDVLNIIEELGKNKTVFMSTHILADVDRICQSVAIINEGKLIAKSQLPELKAKYASPILHIEFNKDPSAIVPELVSCDWARKVEKNGNQVKIWLKDSSVMDDNIPIKSLMRFDIGILDYGLTLPETEDLFVALLEQNNANT